MQKATLFKRKSILRILVGAALLCGLVLLIFLSKDRKPQFATKAGESKAFRFSYVSEGSGKTSGEFMLPGSSESTDSQVSAAWSGIIRFNVEAAATEFTDLLMEIRSASFEARLNQSTLDPVPPEIQGRVRLDQSGRIKYYAFPKAVMDTHGSFLSEIIRFLDLKLPSESEAVGQSEESWPGLQYPISWAYAYPNNGRVEAVKRYDTVSVEGTLISGESRFSLSSSGIWYETIDARREKTKTLNSIVVSRDKTSFSMKSDSSQIRDLTPASAQSADLVTDDLREKYSERSLQIRMHQDQLGETTVEDIKKSMEDIGNLKDSMPVYLKLKALLFLYPDLCKDFLHMLVDFNRLDMRFTSVATALTSVGHKEAQDTLQQAIVMTESDMRKQQALIPHLGMVREPTVESQLFLERLSKDTASPIIRGTAELSLGIMAGNMEIYDEKRARELTETFIQQLNQLENSPEQTIHLLSVLGNSGHPTILDAALKYSQDPHPKIRLAAYHALRDVKDARAFNALLQALQNEPDDPAREVVSRSLRKNPGFVFDQPAFQSVWNKEKNLEVLGNVIRLLMDRRSMDSAIVSMLKEWKKDCGRTEICELLTL